METEEKDNVYICFTEKGREIIQNIREQEEQKEQEKTLESDGHEGV